MSGASLRHPRDAAARDTRSPEQRGFVLVGVVMFVLALTILGISLFTLSNYESQFFDASYNQSQAFYDALSGIERTKYILAATNDPSKVGTDLPAGVIYAGVMQHGDSSRVLWSGTSAIRIRVIAQYPPGTGEVKKIEA